MDQGGQRDRFRHDRDHAARLNRRSTNALRNKSRSPATRPGSTTLAGAQPILALDMYEHSYHIDYGAQAAAYVDAFMAAINWPSVGAAYAGLAPVS
jgi:superoxide dismutase